MPKDRCLLWLVILVSGGLLVSPVPSLGQVTEGQVTEGQVTEGQVTEGQVTEKKGVFLISPRTFGFEGSAGGVRYPNPRENYIVRDGAGNEIVAKLHVEVDSRRIVLMPDGSLQERLFGETMPTDRRFISINKKALATRLAAKFPDFRIDPSHRHVFVSNTSPAFAETTQRVLESMMKGVSTYAKAQRITTREPPAPLVVIMFRTEAEFQAYRRVPRGVVAYYDPITNHVVLYEESQLMRVRPQLGIQQSLSTISHEGAHQILHNIGVQQRLSRWPLWLSEGMAEYFAPTELGRRLTWSGAGKLNNMRMYEIENFLRKQPGLTDGKVVRETVGAANLTSTGYAFAWSLVHHLAKNDRSKFHQMVRRTSKLQPLESVHAFPSRSAFCPENVTVFEEYFPDGLDKIEQQMVDHLKKQPYRNPFPKAAPGMLSPVFIH
jgi:hypothetical protein